MLARSACAITSLPTESFRLSRCPATGLAPALPLLLAAALAWSGRAAVVIHEIHHSPDVKQERVEFVELYNDGTTEVALGGWEFSGALEYRFPPGASLAAGGFVVVAADPAALRAKFGVPQALGPWTGRLSGEGETLVLRDATALEVDRVDYGLGFPWPTVGDAPGNSIELVHPSLDNSLGGNWRASVEAVTGVPEVTVAAAGSTWSIWKGRSEPSSTPGAWRLPGFDDATWQVGPAPVGYDPDVLGPATTGGTRLDDMRGNYTTIYLRRAFDVPSPGQFGSMQAEVLYDDGLKVWLNGELLHLDAMDINEVPFNGVATGTRENNNFVPVPLTLRPGLLRATGNVLAIQVANANLAASSDAFFDGRFVLRGAQTGVGPTPGRANRSRMSNAPPAVRQVAHSPAAPRSSTPVVVSARVTDPEGVASVTLEHQVVLPGQYIRFDSPAYATNWIATPMNDAGIGADLAANDGNWAAIIPSAAQRHRTLVRYRIVARDKLGAEVRVPYADDAGRNFAYFTYDGVPAWTGAVRPGAAGAAGAAFEVGTNEMNRLPVYHLLALRQDVEAATWNDRTRGDEYFWTGTLVHAGVVHDHIRFRPRGGVWRYAMGKNMWKFDFNRGRDLQARDNWGRKMPTPWTKLNLGASIQQGDYLHRGEHGMFESVGFRLFSLMGVPSPETAFVQFRVIDGEAEAPATNQYGGDFWGVYLAVEQLDSRYLDAKGLPDGNLYKMEGGFGDPNNLGPAGPVDSSDLSSFLTLQAATPRAESWWRTNLSLAPYFGYQCVVQAIHHYDIADGKNYFYYRNPSDGRWTVLPWDLDLTWSDNMYRAGQTGGDEPFKNRVLSNFSTTAPAYPAISREFRNRVREFRTLHWNADEAHRLIDEHARLLRGTNAFSLIDADRAQWDYNPVMTNASIVNLSKAGHGRFYQSGVGTRDFAGMLLKMKQYVTYRASDPAFSLDQIASDPSKPTTPSLAYEGTASYPANKLVFRVGTYGGARPQASVRWRIGEVTRPSHPAYDPSRPLPYEVNAVVESGPLPAGTARWSPPPGALRVGRLYRARAQFIDADGGASTWSAPIEFTAGEPYLGGAAWSDLAVSELMYDPAPEGFEFLELRNRNATQSLDLSGARFVDGVGFDFTPGTSLGPGDHVLLIRSTNAAAFRAFHGLADSVRILGSYSGGLANEGETLAIRAAAGSSQELRFTYGAGDPWPAQVNGTGRSLVPVTGGPTDPSLPGHWRASTLPNGSPGRADPDVLRILSVQATQAGLRVQHDGPDAGFRILASSNLRDWTVVPAVSSGGVAVLPWPANAQQWFVRAAW
ncbi:MAG: lamin tail domain-containing protein [Verrucomicrobiota bacterium]